MKIELPQEEFVSYTQAIALKGLGLSRETLGLNYETRRLNIFYSNDGKTHLNLAWYSGNDYQKWLRGEDFTIFAPTYQQAFRWFRREHELESFVFTRKLDSGRISGMYSINGEVQTEVSKSYEKAEVACLNKLIEIVKEKY